MTCALTIFYYLANTSWRNREERNLCTKLFYRNKTLNGFSCFYDTELPEKFFVGHSARIVLVRTQYPEYFGIYQNCTVGRSGDKVPVIDEGVIMFPNSAIVGACRAGSRSYISQGTSALNAQTPRTSIASRTRGAPASTHPQHATLP